MFMSEVLKIGDKVKYTIPNTCSHSFFAGKTFIGEIGMIDFEEKEYGVYTEYGQDYVGFDECEKI